VRIDMQTRLATASGRLSAGTTLILTCRHIGHIKNALNRYTHHVPALLGDNSEFAMFRLQTLAATFSCASACALPFGASAAPGNVDLPRYPSISPDGRMIAFSWRGDLWKAPITGGEAIRLTIHPGDELHSAWSPDGSRIAFNSNRDGYTNIYTMNPDGTDVQQVTRTDRGITVTGWGVDDDGTEVITGFGTLEGDVFREFRPYMVSPDGGALRRIHEAFGAFPVISPDGDQVAFRRGGYYGGVVDDWERRHYDGPEAMDVWMYSRGDGSFTKLTTNAGNDGDTRWLGDRTLIYMSNREGPCVNLWQMSATDGEAVAAQLTNFNDHDVIGFDVARDGATVVLQVWDTLYRLDLDNPNAGPEPIRLTASEDENDNYELKSIGREVSEAALSPDGQVMAMIAYGEVYVRNVEDDHPTRRVTHSHAREKDLAWSPDGLKLYFTSDRDGTEGIYAATVAMTRGELKDTFDDTLNPQPEEEEADAVPDDEAETAHASSGTDDVSGTWTGTVTSNLEEAMDCTIELTLYPSNKITGTLTMDRGVATLIGTYDPDTGAVTLSTTDEDGNTEEATGTIADGELSLRLFVDGGEVVVNATRAGGEADSEADDEANEDDEADEELPKELQPDRWHDALRFAIEPVVTRDTNDREASPSPDGTMLAFRSTRGTVEIMDMESGDIRTLFEHWDAGVNWSWSPDSRYLAYSQSDLNFNDDIFIMPVDGSAAPVNISRHPDSEYDPQWSADGKILTFVSERIDESFDVWLVFLDRDLESYTDLEMQQYFDEAKKAAGKREPLEIKRPDSDDEDEAAEHTDDTGDDADAPDEGDDADEDAADEPKPLDLHDAYLRLRRVTRMDGDEIPHLLTPGGERIIFNASGDDGGLYSIKWDGSDRESYSGRGGLQHISLDGGKVILVSGGQAATAGIDGGKFDTVSIRDDIRIDLKQQAQQKFLEAMRNLGDEFYSDEMNGTDWDELTTQYLQLALQSRTDNEFLFVANRMLGELNASHLGVYGGGFSSPNAQSNGRLGAEYERTADGYKVVRIIDETPAATGPMRLEVGDVITGVELDPLDAMDRLSDRLKGRVGDETIISIIRMDGDGNPLELDLLLTPISYGQFRQRKYEHWRRANAHTVEELSDGRLGYIHVQGMDQPSLDVFERDLFAACDGKDGLIIDVRNNGGGWTADRLLASIMVQEHAYTVPRGAEHVGGHYPQDRLFIQRYTLPTNMLCNEKSFSNAEIVSHAFKTLKRGTLVGQQTYGGVISTGGFGLIDGTFVRLPFRGWYVSDGDFDMELNGAMPDILVPQVPKDEVAGEDMQLKAAVQDLLQRLD
jgi:tricorn protease